MSKKLNIYVHVAENSGVGYYREYLPAKVLKETGKANVMINDFRWGEGNHVEPTEKVFFEVCNWADIIVAGRMDRPEYYSKWGAAKEFFNIPIIMDTDDNIHHVRPTNPGYQGYHPGSQAIVWNNYAMTKLFDAITVTTDHLKESYSKYHPRIYKLPNMLDAPKWDKVPRKRKKKGDDTIRMGFICSASHADGFGIIIKPVYDIMKKYKNVEFYYPEMYQNLFATAPKSIRKRLKTLPWIKLKQWHKGLKRMDLDIGLMPLTDNMFNRSKSNLRYLEYSLAGMAGIVSPVAPYKVVTDGVDGLVAQEQKEWYNAMETLITDEKKRKEIATNAYNKVAKEFNIWDNIDMWLDAYQEVHDKFHEFYGPKKIWKDIGNGKYQEILQDSK